MPLWRDGQVHWQSDRRFYTVASRRIGLVLPAELHFCTGDSSCLQPLTYWNETPENWSTDRM